MKELLRYWEKLTERDQRIALFGGILLTILLLYAAVWSPINQHLEQLQSKTRQQISTLSWLQTQQSLIESFQDSQGGITLDTTVSLEAAVSKTAQKFSVQVTRIQQKKDTVAVTIKPVEFNLLINWLADMDRSYGVKTRVITLEREKDVAGSVVVKSLQLGRQE